MLGGKWSETCSVMAVNLGKSDDPTKEGDRELQQQVEAALEQVQGKQLAPVGEKLMQAAKYTKEQNPVGQRGSEWLRERGCSPVRDDEPPWCAHLYV